MTRVFLASVAEDLPSGRGVSKRLVDFDVEPVPRLHELGAVGSRPPPAPAELADTIKHCVGLVAFVSHASLNSGWWHDALHYAEQGQTPIYPLLVNRPAPSWMTKDGRPLVQDPVSLDSGHPSAAWFEALTSGMPWSEDAPSEEVTVFRVHLSVAWPIWAGGYPTQAQALDWFEHQLTSLRADLPATLMRTLGHGFSIQETWVTRGGYQPIQGLSPNPPEQNSIDLDLVVGGSRGYLERSEDIGDRIERLCQELEGLIAVKVRAGMPDAATGANLYDVISRWDPAQGLTLVETGESSLVDEVKVAQASSSRGTQRTTVFVSYSHKDQRWLTRLQVHLRPLEKRFAIEVWDDTKLRAGDRWREQIVEAMSSARVAILLVSADFVASQFIADNELPPLLEAAERDGAVILPIIVGPSMYERLDDLSRFQAANDPKRPLMQLSRGRQEKLLTQVADRVRSIFMD